MLFGNRYIKKEYENLGQGLNLFDLLVIDLLWWRNTKRTQIEGLDADRELYQNPRKHIDAFYRGMLMFLRAAFISAVVLSHIQGEIGHVI